MTTTFRITGELMNGAAGRDLVRAIGKSRCLVNGEDVEGPTAVAAVLDAANTAKPLVLEWENDRDDAPSTRELEAACKAGYLSWQLGDDFKAWGEVKAKAVSAQEPSGHVTDALVNASGSALISADELRSWINWQKRMGARTVQGLLDGLESYVKAEEVSAGQHAPTSLSLSEEARSDLMAMLAEECAECDVPIPERFTATAPVPERTRRSRLGC